MGGEIEADGLGDLVERCARLDEKGSFRAGRDLGRSASSCSSSMSPTIASTTSSIETNPSVPPYSSMTRAICVREVCIFSRRSSAGIEGGA